MKAQVLILLVFAALAFSLPRKRASPPRFAKRQASNKPESYSLEVLRHAIPYQAYVQGVKQYTKCAGALINTRWILTSGVCFYWGHTDKTRISNKNINRLESANSQNRGNVGLAILGAHDIDQFEESQQLIPIDICNLADGSLIALARLSRDAELNDFVGVAPLRRYDAEYQNVNLFAIGWKYSSLLQGVRLIGEHAPSCDLYTWHKMWRDPNSAICASLASTEEMCEIQEGSPVLEGEKGELVGLATWTWSCWENRTALYAKVSHYIGWIDEITKPDGGKTID